MKSYPTRSCSHSLIPETSKQLLSNFFSCCQARLVYLAIQLTTVNSNPTNRYLFSMCTSYFSNCHSRLLSARFYHFMNSISIEIRKQFFFLISINLFSIYIVIIENSIGLLAGSCNCICSQEHVQDAEKGLDWFRRNDDENRQTNLIVTAVRSSSRRYDPALATDIRRIAVIIETLFVSRPHVG